MVSAKKKSKTKVRLLKAIEHYGFIAFMLISSSYAAHPINSYLSSFYLIVFVISPALYCINHEIQKTPGREKRGVILSAVMFASTLLYAFIGSFLNEVLPFSSLGESLMKLILRISTFIMVFLFLTKTYRMYKQRKKQRLKEEKRYASQEDPLTKIFRDEK